MNEDFLELISAPCLRRGPTNSAEGSTARSPASVLQGGSVDLLPHKVSAGVFRPVPPWTRSKWPRVTGDVRI